MLSKLLARWFRSTLKNLGLHRAQACEHTARARLIRARQALLGLEVLECRSLLSNLPVVSWPTPAAITYGTSLGPSQLDASANIPGSFVYTPPTGTVLPAGQAQTLTVVFTPTDTVNYNSATDTVSIAVNPAPLTVTGITANDKVYDATTTATLNTENAALVGVRGGDVVTISAPGGSALPTNAIPSAILTGVTNPTFLAVDAGGTLYVGTGSSAVTEFAPGSTTPTATLDGFSFPYAAAFDSRGDIYVAEIDNGTVSEFTPGSTTPSATYTGLGAPDALFVDADDNLYVANLFGAEVVKFAPGSTTPSATLTLPTGAYPRALALDANGNLFVANSQDSTVSVFSPGSTTVSRTLTGLHGPDALAFDASGNLYVANYNGGTVSKFAPGSTTASATLTAFNGADALAFDPLGNLYVASDLGNSLVSKFVPGGLTPSAVLAGFNFGATQSPQMVVNAEGDLFVANSLGNSVSKFTSAALGTFGAQGTFASKNVGDNFPVTVTGLTLVGPQAGDYSLIPPVISANITPAPLTVQAVSNDKPYDGTTSAAAIPAVTGLQGNDTVSGLAESYTDPNIGIGKTLTVTGYTVGDGNNGQNYTVAILPNINGVISSLLPAKSFQVTAPVTATAGSAVNFTVMALDANNNPTSAYSGTIQFSSSDGLASLPGSASLTNGIGVFIAAFETVGPQTLSAHDSVNVVNGTSNPVQVSAALAPDWYSAAPIPIARGFHTATLLNNGEVLIAGGDGPYGVVALASAYLYDPASNAWSSAGSMATPRVNDAAVLLKNGMVLVVGGEDSNYTQLASAELYNPVTNTWSSAGHMATTRNTFTATLLNNGMVLVAGGYDGLNSYRSSAELYNPVTNSWSSAASMSMARSNQTATLLNNGMVLVAGGSNVDPTSAELYDPVHNTWSPAASMSRARSGQSATLLPSGQVLVVGGDYSEGNASAELYDPVSNTWSSAGQLVTGRYFPVATLLGNGKVLVEGGVYDGGDVSLLGSTLNSAEFYDPAGNSWSSAPSMITSRADQTATLLQNGNVLVVGGFTTPVGEVYGTPIASAEIYGVPGPAVPTVTISASGVYNRAPQGVSAATVTGLGGGILASFGDPHLSYTYYVGTTVAGIGTPGAPTNAGTYTVVGHWTSSNPGYQSADSAPLTFVITPTPLTVTGITAQNKKFDGSTVAALNFANAALVGVIGGDVVTLDTRAASGTFASSAAGNNIVVTVSGLTLAGPQAVDYTLTQPTTTANITLPTVTVNSLSQLEGKSGLTPFVFQIKLPLGGSSKTQVTYDVYTTDGTAKAGVNFVGISAGDAAHGGTVTFAQGSNYASITIYVVAGSLTVTPATSTAQFTVSLSNPANPSVPLASATGTIIAQIPKTSANPIVPTLNELFVELGTKKKNEDWY